MRAIAIVLVLFVATFACAVPIAPANPQQYQIKGTFRLPYANINEPVYAAYDGVNNRLRIDFYNGMDKYYYLYNKDALVQINPIVTKQVCYRTSGGGQVSSQNFIPDAKTWTMIGEEKLNTTNGIVMAVHMRQSVVNFNRTNVYDYYYDAKSGNPIRYTMLGFDALFDGSHFDQYIMDYEVFIVGAPDSAFALPAICAGDEVLKGDADRIRGASAMFDSMLPCTDDNTHCHFKNFMNKHGKNYQSTEEYLKRHKNFHANFNYVRSYNSNNKHMQLKINQFADMSDNEFSRKILLPKNNFARELPAYEHEKQYTRARLVAALPPSVDWRLKGAVSRVKDQGVCGSCWTFSTTGTIEGALALATGKMVPLSEQNLVDCAWPYDNQGCDGGMQKSAMRYIIDNGGIDTEASYPYLMQDGYCSFKANATGARLSGYVVVPMGDEEALKEAVALHGPVAISIDASHKDFSFYSEGVYYNPSCSNSPTALDHAVLLVGYGTTDDGQDYWIVKNSWSTHWGNNGYVWMARNKGNNCGVATGAQFPIVA